MSERCRSWCDFCDFSFFEEGISVDLKKELLEIERVIVLGSNDGRDRSRLEDIEPSLANTPLDILRESEKMLNTRKNGPLHSSDLIHCCLFE